MAMVFDGWFRCRCCRHVFHYYPPKWEDTGHCGTCDPEALAERIARKERELGIGIGSLGQGAPCRLNAALANLPTPGETEE